MEPLAWLCTGGLPDEGVRGDENPALLHWPAVCRGAGCVCPERAPLPHLHRGACGCHVSQQQSRLCLSAFPNTHSSVAPGSPGFLTEGKIPIWLMVKWIPL